MGQSEAAEGIQKRREIIPANKNGMKEHTVGTKKRCTPVKMITPLS